MTTATATTLSSTNAKLHTHFLLRRLHSLSGIVFGGYLIVHLIVNACLIQGYAVRDTYQLQVNTIHSLPFLWAVEWIFIYLPILYHAIYGLVIMVNASWNVDRYPYGKNWFYVLQRISAVVLIAFIAFHVLGMKGLFGQTLSFDPERATYSTVRHFNSSWIVAYVVYPIGILASAYHTANGFWTAGITWGLTTSAGGQRRWGWACGGLFVLLLGCGILALIAVASDAASLDALAKLPARG